MSFVQVTLHHCKISSGSFIGIFVSCRFTPFQIFPDSKVHGATMGPTWVLPAPDGPYFGPMNLSIWVEPKRALVQRNRDEKEQAQDGWILIGLPIFMFNQSKPHATVTL